MKLARATLLLATTSGLAGCADSPGEPEAGRPALLSIAGAPGALDKGDTVRLSAMVRDQRGGTMAGASVAWSSLDGSTASVAAASGLVTALDTGVARIVARSGDAADTVSVSVVRRLTTISIELPQDSVLVGASLVARAVARDFAGTPMPAVAITWSSSDAAVITVNDTGLVRGSDEGTVTLHATSGSVVGSRTVRSAHRRLDLGGVIPKALGLGNGFACVLDAAGQAHCWGSNADGRLGRGTIASSFSPIGPVSGDQRFVQLDADANSACGVTAAGRLFCWGRRAGVSGSSAVPVAPIDSVVMRSAHVGSEGVNCGLALDGRPWCWGRNDAFQAGYSPQGEYQRPLPMEGDLRFGVFTIGFHDACGLPGDRLPVCRGDINRYLTGDANVGAQPLRIDDAPPMAMVVGLGSPPMVCGLTASGEVWCWGLSEEATGSVVIRPTRVANLPPIRSIVGSYQGACGLDAEGGAWCWSQTAQSRLQPVRWAAPLRFKAMDIEQFSGRCGITLDDKMICTGAYALP